MHFYSSTFILINMCSEVICDKQKYYVAHISLLGPTIKFYPFRPVKIQLFESQKEFVLILSQTTNFKLFQTKKFAYENFKLDENGRKLFIWVENTEGQREIARYEQFLLFPLCFQKTNTADT